MNFERFEMPIVVASILAGTSVLAQAWQPGNYPVAPQRMATQGFRVNNLDRNDALAFWHAIYQASEGYETRVGWSGNYTGNPGTLSGAFVDDVERRLNYFRAICGVDASAAVNSGAPAIVNATDAFRPPAATSKAAAAQSAAVLIARNYNPSTGQDPALSHAPPPNLAGWSAAAWNGCANGNFSFGAYGPGAVTEYMIEKLAQNTSTSSWNSLVGHRRWCVFPRSTDFATGDQPGTSAQLPPSNVFYVVQAAGEKAAPAGPDFVCYPPPGYLPAPINTPYWSLSCEGGDLSAATVRVTDSRGAAVGVSNVVRSTSYGDPALIWQVSGDAGTNSVAADRSYDVTVSGIRGAGKPPVFRYRVTLFNPEQLTGIGAPAGPSAVGLGKAAAFAITAPVGSEALQVVTSCRKSTTWIEDAEIPAKAAVIDHTDASYPLIVNPLPFIAFGNLTGKNSFNLTFPRTYDLISRSIPEQSFELDRELLPGGKSALTFQFRRGFMTRDTFLAVESTRDGGVTWQTLRTIPGASDTQYDTKISTASVPLSKSSTPVRVRFRYYAGSGRIFTHEAAPKYATGIFIDNISTTKCQWLQPGTTRTVAAATKSYAFKTKVKGKYLIRVRAKLGGKWFAPGPARNVRVKK